MYTSINKDVLTVMVSPTCAKLSPVIPWLNSPVFTKDPIFIKLTQGE